MKPWEEKKWLEEVYQKMTEYPIDNAIPFDSDITIYIYTILC